MKMSVRTIPIARFALVGLLAGCTASDTAPVEGIVTFDGQPVGGATVTFKHEVDGALSVGTTKADGAFALSSPGSQDQIGAKVGRHQVMISAVEIVQPESTVDPSLGSLTMAAAGGARIRQLLPSEYGEFETSGLTFEVAAGRKNLAKFELTR